MGETEWTSNPEYDTRFDGFTHSSSQPQLVEKANIHIRDEAMRFMSNEENIKAKKIGSAPSFCPIKLAKRDEPCIPKLGNTNDPVYESNWGNDEPAPSEGSEGVFTDDKPHGEPRPTTDKKSPTEEGKPINNAPEERRLVAIANKNSEEKFGSLLKQFGHGPIAE